MTYSKYMTISGHLKNNTPQNIKQEYAENKVLLKHGGDIMLVSPYTRVHDKHKFICDKGHEWFSIFNDVANKGTKCPRCSGKYTPNQEEARNKVSIKHSGRVELASPYTSVHNNHKFICNKGHTFYSSYNHVANRGSGCPKCVRKESNIIYLWNLVGTNIYKFGITSDSLGYSRIKEVANIHNVAYDILVYKKDVECRLIESIIKEHYSEYKADMRGDGSTEMLELSGALAKELVSLLLIL